MRQSVPFQLLVVAVSPIVTAHSPAAKANALSVFQKGGLVAIPTETVYGLAADATNGQAVARIYEVKGRPNFNPLIAHCSTVEMVMHYGDLSPLAMKCADHFWPGPLTLVVPYRTGLSDLVRAGLNTIALRVPQGISADIIAELGKPIAAPSANLSGRVSPTTADHVYRQLGNKVDLILDNGPCEVGLESTIVSFAGDTPVLLRPGGIATEVLETFLGMPLQEAVSDAPIIAPGMLASHYAPLASVRLDATAIDGEDGALNFGMSHLKAARTLTLSETGNLREAAARLFSCLADFDQDGIRSIAVAPIPDHGLGKAINDRLRRAAVPRV